MVLRFHCWCFLIQKSEREREREREREKKEKEKSNKTLVQQQLYKRRPHQYHCEKTI
jgi:hypothetical protein